MFHCMLLALARKKGKNATIDHSSLVEHHSQLVSSLFLFIPRVGCKMPSPGKIYGLLKECFD